MLSLLWFFFLVLIPSEGSSLRGLQQEEDVFPRPFVLLSSSEIHQRVLGWKNTYHDFVRVTTAQEEYGLQRAGGIEDCPFDDDEPGCLNYIVRIQDYMVHPVGSDSSNRLPTVLWSGAVHGDERVGPTTVVETASLLLEAAACERKPMDDEDEAEARACRMSLGVTDGQRKWMARLVSTRRIVIVPTANALGYFRGVRRENYVDPNRDFPYDLRTKSACMYSITARTINEVFRDELVQLALTFHGGVELIGYSWGCPSFFFNSSPDEEAQNQIAGAYSRYSGRFGTSNPYRYGGTNRVLYYVRGGMEDWAYASSWDSPRTGACHPDTFGGYPANKTTYNDSVLRVYNTLVEISHRKTPDDHLLGTNEDVLNPDSPGNGYIPKNMRIALLNAELVEPYVAVVGVNGMHLSYDIIPGPRSCDTPRVMVPAHLDTTTIAWTVGGAMTIDATNMWFGDQVLHCVSQPSSLEDVEAVFTRGGPALNGTGYFAGADPAPPADFDILGPLFTATVNVSGLTVGDRLVVMASARVDGSWVNQPDDIAPVIPPQAHAAQVRTNASWYHENEGKIVQGRLDWFSLPIVVEIGPMGTRTTDLTRRLDPTLSPTVSPAPSIQTSRRPTFPRHSKNAYKLGRNYGGAGGMSARRLKGTVRFND